VSRWLARLLLLVCGAHAQAGVQELCERPVWSTWLAEVSTHTRRQPHSPAAKPAVGVATRLSVPTVTSGVAPVQAGTQGGVSGQSDAGAQSKRSATHRQSCLLQRHSVWSARGRRSQLRRAWLLLLLGCARVCACRMQRQLSVSGVHNLTAREHLRSDSGTSAQPPWASANTALPAATQPPTSLCRRHWGGHTRNGSLCGLQDGLWDRLGRRGVIIRDRECCCSQEGEAERHSDEPGPAAGASWCGGRHGGVGPLCGGCCGRGAQSRARKRPDRSRMIHMCVLAQRMNLCMPQVCV
jgi:hypothetical protein